MTFREANIVRLCMGIKQCEEVLGVPRRLGGDATDKELADDKRTARRVKHRLEVALEDWSNGPGKVRAVADGSGARLVWSEWWEAWQENATELRQQADNRDEQHSIDRELEGLAHVFADLR